MTANQHCRAILQAAAASLLLSACGPTPEGGRGTGGAAGGQGRIEGTVFYRERMMLPPGAEVEVQLQDISRPDALAAVLVSVTLTPTGGPPYPFAIDYDPARIDSRLRYALRATIAVEGQLLFSSNEYIDPFAGNPVEVLVQRVPEAVSSDQNP